jgi:hypothetical protein
MPGDERNEGQARSSGVMPRSHRCDEHRFSTAGAAPVLGVVTACNRAELAAEVQDRTMDSARKRMSHGETPGAQR